MRKINLLGQSALGSVALFGAVAFASPALAQPQVGPPEAVVPEEQDEDEDRDGDQVPSGADGQPAEEGTITVTGSRIRLPNIESFEPIITVDEEFIEDRNLTNVADALNELPGFRGSVTPAGAQGSFGQGVNFVNQYGLGSNRTLTLVNGRRFVSSNVPTIFNQGSAGTQVDLNVIPVALIDRIDTVGVGGAPVYGSDAISGTVNVILRTRFEGLEVNALSGISEEGDNFRYSVSGVLGINFADNRGNIVLSAARDVIEGVVFNDRDFLRERVGGAINPTDAQAAFLRPNGPGAAGDPRINPGLGFNNSPTDLNPGTVLVRGVTIPFLTAGGLISGTNLAATNPNNPAVIFGRPTTQGLQFDTNGNLVPFNQGVLFPGTSSAGGEGFSFADYTQITSDLERNIFNAFLNFDLTEGITLFGEATYFRSRADELVQQPTFNSSLFGGLSGQLAFSTDNPFLTDQARGALASRGVTTFFVSRNSDDLADLTGFAENEVYRVVAGVRGDFNLIGRVFNYEISGNYGETDITDFGQDLNAQNFINAVNVTRNAAGQIVCTTAPTRTGGNGFAAPGGTPVADPNCVPLNLFGRGAASQAARDYIVQDRTVRSELTQTVFNANVGGTLFDAWGAGAAGINVGYEYRKETGSFDPDEFTSAGLGRSVAIAPVQGEYELNEFFGEVIVPLVSPELEIPFIHRADVFARGRYVDNTINGGFFSYAVGGTLAPIRDVQFRGNYTRSFRSPAITELFFPQSPSFSFVADLCSPANRNAGPVPDIRARNCGAFLARFPNATPLDAATASVPSISGGNPDLENEVAESWTAGVIIRPRWIPRLSITADWINIDIENPIANLAVATIVSGCFDNEDFNLDDPANGNAFCSQIDRQPAGTTDANGRDIGGQVRSDSQNPGVRFGFVNGNIIEFEGLQGTLNYNLPLDFVGLQGSFDVGLDALYVEKRLTDLTGVAPSESQGLIGDPQFAANIRVRYSEEQWGISSSINFTGNQAFGFNDRDDRDVREIDELDSYVVVNAGMFFNVNENFRFNFSVTNLFNEQGQEYFGVLIPASFVDLLGRRYAASVRLNF